MIVTVVPVVPLAGVNPVTTAFAAVAPVTRRGSPARRAMRRVIFVTAVLVAVPLGVVTVMLPGFAPAGTRA
jgi:hypothetical protein